MDKTVLVVDDEKLIVKGIRFSLEQEGMQVDCAYDGEEAVAMAKQKEYAVVLLDVMLPGMDGFELFSYMEKFHIPVIYMTAKTDSESEVRGLRDGAEDYIVKPFEKEELILSLLRLKNNIFLIRMKNLVISLFALFFLCI